MDPGPCFLGSNKAKIDVDCCFQKHFIGSSIPELKIEAAFLCQDDLGSPGKTGTFILFYFFFNIYLFGCVGSQLQHAGSSLHHGGSFIVMHGLSKCGAWALEHSGSLTAGHRLSCPEACGILVPQPGIQPTSPALQGRFLTSGPPVNSQEHFILTDIISNSKVSDSL